MRRLSNLVVLGAILCAASRGLAATEPDSTAAASTYVSPQVFSVYLERDTVRSAVYIEPHADGMVAITSADGKTEYLPLYRIERIEDSGGADRTTDVTNRGKRLGAPIPRPARLPEQWKPYRFRAGSPSECGSYLITDFALLWQTEPANDYLRRDQGVLGAIDLGYARNVGRSNSIGGSVFFGGDGARTNAGLRLRLYSWLAPNVSFDIAPGIVLLAEDESIYRFVFPGFSGQAGLTFGGRFGFVAQVFSVKRRAAYGYERTDTALHAGFRLGAEPGIAGSAVFLFATAISKGEFRPTSY